MVRLLICGGGNGAHCYAGIAASQPGVEVRVLTLYSDEAKRWSAIQMNTDLEVKVYAQGKVKQTLKAKPVIITKDPSECAVDADIVVLTVPAFAHGQYLEALKPHVRPGWVLAGMPGQPGFEFQVRGIWGVDTCKTVSIMAFESLPWACRMVEFGKKAEVLGVKNVVWGAINKGAVDPPQDALAMLQKTIGECPHMKIRGHIIGMTFMAVNAIIHPCILYEHWKNWDGKPIKGEPPLVYLGVTKEECDTLSKCGDEVIAIAKAIRSQNKDVDLSNVDHITDWIRRAYVDNITDPTSLLTCFRTNSAYNGLKHPAKVSKADNTYVLDTGNRYLTEDVPYGLVVLRGIAEIAGVATPVMDKVLFWGQKQLEREYLVDGKIKGKDIDKTRCPQAYGFKDMTTVLGK